MKYIFIYSSRFICVFTILVLSIFTLFFYRLIYVVWHFKQPNNKFVDKLEEIIINFRFNHLWTISVATQLIGRNVEKLFIYLITKK